MALSMADTDTQTPDESHAGRYAKQYGTIYEEKFENTETCEKVIVVDPRLDKTLQINATSQSYSVWVTTTPGEGVTDWLDSAVPWIVYSASVTDDLLSGGADINKGVWAIKIVSAALTADFQVCVKHIADD